MARGNNCAGFALSYIALILAICSVTSASDSVPAFVWSNAKSVLASSPIDYEVLSGESLASRLFSGLSNVVTTTEGPLPAPLLALVDGQQPDLVLAFVGKELKTGHVAQFGEDEEGESNPLQGLKAALKDAASSIVLPYITGAAAGSVPKSVTRSLVGAFQKNWPASRIALFGNCPGAPAGALILESVEEIKAFLEERTAGKAPGSMDFMIVCPAPTSANSPLGALLQEGKEFQTAYSAVQQVGIRHMALYTAEPQSPFFGTTSRRSALDDLTSVDGTAVAANVTCDETCHTKAMLLEVLATVVVLLITLLSGLCCLAAVDTPTRFEAPRET